MEQEVLIGSVFLRLKFVFSPAAVVCLGCLPTHPLASSQAWNNRMLIESKKEGLRVEGQARAFFRSMCTLGSGLG